MLKKIFLSALAFFIPFTPYTYAQNSSSQEQMEMNNSKILVAYFSHSGNTKVIAEQIHKLAGGDIFEIKTVHQYPQDYNAVVKEAREEVDSNSRPELASSVENMAAYDIIILGYPNWWNTMPMGVFTFLEQYDFSGKTIVPFCTHEGSRLGNSVRDIAKLCPQAKVMEGLAIRGGTVTKAQADVADWLRKLAIIN